MKTDINKESFIKSNLSNSSIRNVKVSALGLTLYKIKLQLDNILFKDIDEIETILKNVKTRDLFLCESKVTDNVIHINLKPLSFICTDNEFMLLIIIKKDGIYSFINPIINDSYINISENFTNLDLNNIEWYLRTLENGEIRLSTIVKSYSSKLL